MKTPQQAAQAWRDSAGRAATNYQSGVQGYSGDWAGRTVAQQPTLVSNFNAAVSSGRWAAGVQAVGSQGWKAATVAKISNFSTGFAAGADRQAAAIAKVLAAEQTISSSLPPRGSFEANKARMTAMVDQLHALRGQLGAR